MVWRLSDLARLVISKLPFRIKIVFTNLIAFALYYPLSRLAGLFENLGLDYRVDLYLYRRSSIYTMKTDALDRFGTRLEKRFSRKDIESLMKNAGLTRISFKEEEPYWVALGYTRRAIGLPCFMNILVSGATGFIGYQVAAKLSERGGIVESMSLVTIITNLS